MIKNPFYGSNSGPVGKLVPIEERITYSWNNINVFTTPIKIFERDYLCCGRTFATIEEDRGKHILKNGKK